MRCRERRKRNSRRKLSGWAKEVTVVNGYDTSLETGGRWRWEAD